MKIRYSPSKSILLIYFLLVIGVMSSAQSDEQIVQSYFDLNHKTKTLKLHHGPVTASFGDSEKATLFFVVNNEENYEYKNHAVLYDENTKNYTNFGYFSFDSAFDSGVIAVFFENVDQHPKDELIVLYLFGTRTFYSDGPYAGIKFHYQTRVFKCETINNDTRIIEYKAIGDLLTVNQPMTMGTIVEEDLIGRDSGQNLEQILGVTCNASQVKKRIKHLKQHGLLGGMSK